MNTTAQPATTHKSRSGAIDITMQFRTANSMWDVTATKPSGERFATKFFLTEDEAKAYANVLWATDGPAPVQPSLVDLAAEFSSTPAPAPRQDWFAATGQSSTPRAAQASEAQVRFITSLVAEREVPATGGPFGDAAQRIAAGNLTKSEASPIIEWLQSLPRKASSAPYTGTPDVPAGHYATPSRTGNNDLDFWRVDRPTEGRWAGRTFVKRVIGGHEDQPVRGSESDSALEAILLAGLEEASRAYGQAIGRCGRCNRSLTDETSRAYGIGPDCRSKGW